MWPDIDSVVSLPLISFFFTIGVLVSFKTYLVRTWGVCKSKNKLTGKTVIITGASAGIGKETAIDLACREARVILACRDLNKAEIVKGILKKDKNSISVLFCNLFEFM